MAVSLQELLTGGCSMAAISKKGDAYYCAFRYGGKRYYFTIGKVLERVARAKSVEVDQTLTLLQQGRIELPENVDLADFVAAGGKAPAISVSPESMTARQIFDDYLKTHSNGTIEENSLLTLRTHLSQMTSSLGERFRLQKLTLLDLQKHVDKRQKNGISTVTIKKEITTLRSCWNWAVNGKRLNGAFPGKGLRLPKEEEKEPFRSFEEIESILRNEKPDVLRTESLWEALYLTRSEVTEFLAHVRDHATLPWVYPMIAFAAFTGARRSEMLRSLAADVDFAGGTITVREKKRVRGKRSTRTVPMQSKLVEALQQWVKNRPNSAVLFCQAPGVTRSKTVRTGPTAITRNEAHDHFKRTLEGSKWSVVRGWHVLRHSFISALASNGVDQRVIDEIVGHQSEEQRLRYRHLYPKVMKDAIDRVFG